MDTPSNNKILKSKQEKSNRQSKSKIPEYTSTNENEGSIADFNSNAQDPANVISFGDTLQNSLDQDQIQNIKNFVRDARINSDKIDIKGKNEMLDLIDSNANAYNQFNTLTKIKYFYLKHEWTFIAIRECCAIGIIVLSILLYASSLKSEKSYEKYNMYFYYPMTLISLIKCLISGGIVGFIIFCMYAKWIFLEHLIYMVIVYSILIYKNFGNNILNHGKYNFFLLLISSTLVFLLLVGVYLVYRFSRTIKYLYLIEAVLVFFGCFLICYNFKYKYEKNYSCEKWDLTLNKSDIFVDENNEKCNLEVITGLCYMNKIFNYFDLTLGNNIKCENREKNEINNFYKMIKDENMTNYDLFAFPSTVNINKEKNLNTTKNLQHYIFNNLIPIRRRMNTISTINNLTNTTNIINSTNIPNTTNIINTRNLTNITSTTNIANITNIINTTNITNTTKIEVNYTYLYSKYETIIEFNTDENNNTQGELTINLIKDKVLSETRKKISENFFFKKNTSSLYDNILVIFLSSISRAHFQRGMPKLSKFISKLMQYEPFPTMTSYQFSKYKNFNYTMENILSLFYKKTNDSYINSLKYLKESGYITGQVSDICDKNMNNKNVIDFDHENFIMSCDPNYFMKKEFSPYERCLYGKPISNYMLNYTSQFWEKYNENKKYFRMSFNYGNEPTGNVIKYLDEPLYNFLWDFYTQGKLKNTAVIILSEQGNKNNGLYDVLGSAEFEVDKKYGVFIMILDWNEKFKKEEYHKNLIKNQNLFITPYDVFDTINNIALGDIYNEGNSVLKHINNEDTYCYKN